ncbi:hypothetical protein JL722_12684 [Aureococcus anophagefferens]|nr:hypothetical protein JL722_12684 [Aureococcus anophagefferens]
MDRGKVAAAAADMVAAVAARAADDLAPPPSAPVDPAQRGGTIWRGAAAHGAPVDPAQRADAAAVSRIAKKLRNRACERGERVRLLELVDDVCSAHGVRSLRDLGLSVAAVDELRSLRQLEGLLEIQICAFVESRFIATLHDLSHNLCAAHGVRAFEDLRLGPILKQPLVQRKFYADEALTAVPALEVADVVRELEKFRFKKRRVDLEEFLNWLAAKRGVASPRSLCLTMSKYAIGTTIKYASQAARDEKDSRVAALKQLRDARRDEWRAALGAKVEAGSSAARLGAQLSDAARLAVVEYGGLGATEPFGKVAGKIASAVVAAKNAKKKLSVAAELAACYVVTLGEIDVEATRLAVAEAQGLTDHDVANERGSFSRSPRATLTPSPLAARFAAAAGGVAAGVPDDGDDDGDGDGGADDGSTAVSALDEACERALSRPLRLDAPPAVEAAVSTAAPRAWAPGGFALWLSGLADRAGLGVADLAALGCGADVAAFVRRCLEAARPARARRGLRRRRARAPPADRTASAGRSRLRRRSRTSARGSAGASTAAATSRSSARGVSVVVAEDRVYKLLAEPSLDGLGAACARGDAAGAAAHVATLVVKKSRTPRSSCASASLTACCAGGSGGDAVALACEVIAAAPPPLRPPVADALLPALEAARGSRGRRSATCSRSRSAPPRRRAPRPRRPRRGLRRRPRLPHAPRGLLGGRRPGTDARDGRGGGADAAEARGRRSRRPPGVGAGRAGGHDAGGGRTARRAPDDASAASSEPERAARDDEPPGAVLASIRAGFGLETDDARIDVSQSGQLQMLDNALKVIARDIYSSDSHFILELLQNADDNDYAPSAAPTIVFDASPEAVVVRNNERGFRARHVRALCHVGASSKGAGGSGYIGQKGIGFKSVFRVSSRPEVHSNGYAFALDEHMVVPAPCRGPPSPELASWLAAAGLAAPPRDGTTIVLPLTDEFRGDAKRAELRERLAEVDPLLLLFLNRVRRIDVVDRGADGETTARSMRRADAPARRERAVFVLHADWILASSRETVREDSPWNQWLRDEAAGLYVDALAAVRSGAGAGAGFDVARVLEALPVEREVVGFFRPVAAEIARRVRGVECCLAADGTWALPSRALAVPERPRREAPGLLARAPALLGRSCLDQAFQDRLRPETRAALGVEALDASHALRLAAALADADDLGRPSSSSGPRSSTARPRPREASRRPTATASGRSPSCRSPGRAAPGPRRSTSTAASTAARRRALEGFAAVRADLAVVDPAALAPSLARPMVVSVLRSAGVKDATAEAACLEHVLRRRRGRRRRGSEAAQRPAAGGSTFSASSAARVPKPAPRMLERDAWPDAWAAAARDVFSVGDARVVAHDVHSEALERLLAELARDAKPANEAVVRALCAAARWAAPMAKTTATLARPGAREAGARAQPGVPRASVPSSTATLLAETRWVPGAAGGATRLFRPRELYSPLLGLSELYGPRVPVPTDGVRDAARDSPRPYAALGLRDSFGARDALLVLETWAAEEGPFEATVAHFENLYRLLYQELQRRGGAAAAIREFFARGKCTWVPDYRYEAEADDGKRAVVPGAFYALSDCVWADHSRVIDSCVHRASPPRCAPAALRLAPGLLLPEAVPRVLRRRPREPRRRRLPALLRRRRLAGRPGAVPTAHDLAGHIAIAAALAELDVPHASACADVEAVLRVVSFAILAGRLSEQNVAFLPHLLRGKKVWPTSCGAFAAAEGDRILVIDDDEGLRETLFADADVAAAIALVETKTFHEGVQFSRHALHDELAALLPRAQRWLRSERRDLYDARRVARSRPGSGRASATRCTSSTRSAGTPCASRSRRSSSEATGCSTRGALDDGDWDPVLRAVAEHFVGRGDAATTLADALAMTRTYGDKHFDRRAVAALPPDEPEWRATAIEAALENPNAPPTPTPLDDASDDGDASDDDDAAPPAPPPPKPRSARKDGRDAACWRRRRPGSGAESWPPPAPRRGAAEGEKPAAPADATPKASAAAPEAPGPWPTSAPDAPRPRPRLAARSRAARARDGRERRPRGPAAPARRPGGAVAFVCPAIFGGAARVRDSEDEGRAPRARDPIADAYEEALRRWGGAAADLDGSGDRGDRGAFDSGGASPRGGAAPRDGRGDGPFLPRSSAALEAYCACSAPLEASDGEMATEFERYLPAGEATDAQRRLGQAGEALAAAWLRARGELFFEVKTTAVDDEHKPMEISVNHLDFARAHPAGYFILRVFAAREADTFRACSVSVFSGVAEAIENKAIRLMLRM